MKYGRFDQALSEIGIFRSLSDSDRAAIARRCNWRKLDAHSTVLAHLDLTDDVYFVVQGRLRAINYALNGKPVSFRDIGPGDVFGEYSAIDGEARSANVYTLDDAVVGALSAGDFAKTLARHPGVAMAIMRRFTGQIRVLTERIFEFSTLSVNDRIHAELYRLALEAGVVDNTATIAPMPTHAEFASRISTHREGVTRELTEISHAGLIEKIGRDLIVRDFNALEKLVASCLAEYAPRNTAERQGS